ncbi:MAG TPA: transcription elongation factor GreA [Dehalococcoidia bacterium]
MPEKGVPLTREGYAKLQQELEYLRTVRRHEVAELINEARGIAQDINNAEYENAKREQAFVEGRILTLEKMLQNAILIDEEEAHHATQVQLGSTVTIAEDGGKPVNYTIVGSAEANPAEGKISNESPVGRALLGKRVGEVVEIQVPAGIKRYTIVQIS